MPKYEITISMSEGGRDGRDAHHIVMHGEPNDDFDRTVATDFAEDLTFAIASILFAPTHFLNVKFTPLNSAGKALANQFVSIPITRVGFNEFDEGDGPSADSAVLRIAKSPENGRNGSMLLRHAISAAEYAAYTTEGTMPARIASLPVSSYYAAHTIGAAIMKAFTDNNWQPLLERRENDGDIVYKDISSFAAQDFRLMRVTRRRKTADQSLIESATREMAEKAAELWSLFRAFAVGTHPADVLVAITAGIAVINGIYNGLPPAMRTRVRYPALPDLTP